MPSMRAAKATPLRTRAGSELVAAADASIDVVKEPVEARLDSERTAFDMDYHERCEAAAAATTVLGARKIQETKQVGSVPRAAVQKTWFDEKDCHDGDPSHAPCWPSSTSAMSAGRSGLASRQRQVAYLVCA